MVPENNRSFAYFITPHGYGHAARSVAVMNAIYSRVPTARFEIFTRTPIWFFHNSLAAPFHFHEVLTDIGLIQSTSMTEDLPETIRKLGDLLPYRPALVHDLARQVAETGCEMVFCDIAPLGIAVAREAGLPSVLIENFTWDWIYTAYLDAEPRFEPFIRYLHETFRSAEYHIQTDPACVYDPTANLLSAVVARKPRVTRAETRQRLGVAEDAPLIMITMGGIVTQYPFLNQLERAHRLRFLIPGGSDRSEQRGSLVLIPHHSDFYHPDLVAAADVIVGKLGYSTLAETYTAGLPFVYVPRAHFPESKPLGRFAQQKMGAVELPEERFFNGAWLDLLPDLLARSHRTPTGPNGADQIARFLLEEI